VTTFLLARHAAHEWLGRGIPGRLPGVGLSAQGREQAQELAARLQPVALAAIYSSPQQRTRETAAAVAARRELPVQIEPGFDEIDFGQWTGRSFDELRAQGQAWTQWVQRRGSAQPPDGERFADVPMRALAALRRLARQHPDQHVLVVSHGDVLKAIVATVLGMSLDHLERFDIAPVSVTVLAMGEDWQQLQLLNGQGTLR
jgi:broad specificity phosphatase PhoE